MKADVSEYGGPLCEAIDQFRGEENGAARLAEFKLWLKGVTVRILKHVGDIAVGPVKKFVVAEKFVKSNPKVKFYDFGKNFTDHFLGKIEEGVQATALGVDRLVISALDPEIMVELGAKHRIITLAEFYGALELQGQGQLEGLLRVDGWANFAYIRDINGNVWAVRAYWDAGLGWSVRAGPVVYPLPWGVGDVVLSRKSVGI